VWSERDTLKDSDVAIESSTNLHNLTARVRSALISAETRRVLAQPVSGLSARDLALRAVATLNRDPSLAGVRQARRLVDEALRLEPELEPALTVGATVVDFENDVDPKPDHDRIVREMDEFTARAISLDPSDPFAWHTRGIALIYLGRWDAALEGSAKRISLDPYDPSSYVARAWILNMTGRPDEALSMNPVDMAFALRIACEVYLFSGQAEQAIATCEKASGTSTYWFIYVVLAAAYANNGDMEKAGAAKAEILRIVPDYTIAQLRAKRYSAHLEYQRRAEKYWYGGLRKAGIPEQ
jgi:tetratricopeptide (TPR) repeat protein